jgi:co-chaperonin GroES (HSP10)
MPFMLMEHSEDPRNDIYKKVGIDKKGKIPGFELHGNRVLIGVYKRPEKTKSGIYLGDQTRKEDEYQGKAGLVLSKGHSAFVSDSEYDFGPDQVEVGDWVLLFVSHGLSCNINGQQCRVVRDQDICMRIPTPDAVF